jgi:hypothetical protein
MRLKFRWHHPGRSGQQVPGGIGGRGHWRHLDSGPAVTDSGALEEVERHGPIGAGEAVVKMPPVIRSFVAEAVSGTYEHGR